MRQSLGGKPIEDMFRHVNSRPFGVRSAALLALVVAVTAVLTSCLPPDMPDQLITVKTDLMLPSYKADTAFAYDEFAYDSTQPTRGDVIAYQHPTFGLPGIARIVGLPGENVVFDRGVIVVNDVALNEPYIDLVPDNDREDSPVELDSDEYYLIIDNRNSPYADRIVVTSDLILGKAVYACTRTLPLQCESILDVDYITE
jgi:signal peptidase I